MHSGLKRRWVVNYAIIVTLVLMVIELAFIYSINRYYYSGVQSSLEKSVGVTAGFFNNYSVTYEKDIKRLIEAYPDRNEVEMQLVDPNGHIVVSSSGLVDDEDIETADYIGALAGDMTAWKGKNPKTAESVMSVSMPLKGDNFVYGVLRVTTSLVAVDREVYKWVTFSIIAALFIICVLYGLSLLFSHSIIRPINEISAAAKDMAAGHLSTKIVKRYNDEIGELADVLNHMSEELGKVQVLKNDFIASVSHELRTPLTAIRGWAETIKDTDSCSPAEFEKGMQIIINETDRLSDLVEELLDFSRMESGRISLQLDKTYIQDDLGDILHIFKMRGMGEHISIETDIDGELPMIVADTSRMRQVFVNILDNAFKFTSPGGIIRVSAQKQGQRILISFQDNGCGIRGKDLMHIKEKFYKADQSKPGSGIGLAVCEEIMQLHKGQLSIESTYEEGTNVILTIPIQ